MRALLPAVCLAVVAVAGSAMAKTHGAKTPHARSSPSPVASPTPAGARVLALTSGAVAVPLDLSLELRGTPLSTAGEPAPQRLLWNEENGVEVGTARGRGWSARLTLAPSDVGAALDVEIQYRVSYEVEKEAIRVRLPGNAIAIDRDLAPRALDQIQRVDRGTPVFVATTSMAIAGGPGIAAARYLPGRWRGGTFVDAELVLDDAAAHPFGTYEQCLEKLPTADENDPNAPVNWTELEKKTPRDRITRPAGAVDHASATIVLREPEPAIPLVVERWPAGAKAAFVITDHADRTDPAALRAVLYGTSDEKAEAYGKKGLFGHGLALTKTFFAHGARAGTLETDAQAKALADEIVAHGSEVGSHSITSVADPRDVVEKGLPAFDPWHVVTWIDHEPYTNCEALSNEGWGKKAPWGIVDLLDAHGYRWVWTATDRPGMKEAKIVNLFSGPPAQAEPAFFPFPPDPRLMTFRSVWFYAPPATLAKAIDFKSLDALEKARGLFVAHTYLSASLATTKIEEHKADIVVKKNAKTGALELDPKLDEAFARLEARQKAGSLLTMSWRDAGDRLMALGDVEVSYAADGSAVVENHGASDVKALTLAVASDTDLSVDGLASVPGRKEPGRTTIWVDLPAGARVVVRASRGGAPIPLVASRRVTLVPR